MTLRVALLSMMEPAHAGLDRPRAYLRLGGTTLARHQLSLALAAGCERIACLARALDPELVELQHEAERAGARFHMISGGRALSGLVTASDEVLVLAEGVVPSSDDTLNLISQAQTILVLPADTAVPAGFERIDINHAAAGVMLIPGRLVERLNDLPSDVEPVSALLRIALQAGVSQRLVPQAVSASGRWLLVRDEDQAHAAEDHWMERQTAGLGRSPGLGLAAWIARRYGPALLHAGSGPRTLMLFAIALLALAGGAAWFDWAGIGLLLCVPAWILHRTAAIIAGVRREALGGEVDWLSRPGPFGWLLDAAIVALLVVAMPHLPGEPLWQRALMPLVLIGLLRLLARVMKWRFSPWLEDRALLCLVAGGLAFSTYLPVAIAMVILALLTAGIGLPDDSDGITRA
ncbi:hypothetical protein [Novosphingobium sp. TH158]|uniref:hypothetical protein n=1 Tax=Novosphingobium sp. TH158 TaxID=2067455 RepID=UPI000C7B3C44|nr:hypothetical protein [Novosphingobium sp. TH158]PLK25817.1 hypothetical protein C0V78_02085 [Novosphingobium sp. TH158]